MSKACSGRPLAEACCNCLLVYTVASKVSLVFVIVAGHCTELMREVCKSAANKSLWDSIGVRLLAYH